MSRNWDSIEISLRDVRFGMAPVMSETDQLRQQLERARQKLEEQDRFLKGLSESGFALGTILRVSKDRAIVSIGPMVLDVRKPNFECLPGTPVRVIQQTNQVFSVSDAPNLGPTGVVVGLVTPDTVEVTVGGQARTVVLREGITVKPGDELLIDESGHIALHKHERKANVLTTETGVSWDDIGGLEAAKEAIREAIEYPIRYADLYRAYGKAPSKGVLLYGPPGCGKTMVGKATATAIRQAHGDAGGAGGFLYVRGPELLDKFVGATESSIRGLFAKAREYKAQHGHAAVVFIDEAEALLGRRGGRPTMEMETTVVPAFLAEMDGLTDSGAFVMLATNRPDSLDSAVTRDGRIDRRVEIGRPTPSTASEVLALSLRSVPLTGDLMGPELLENVVALMYSDEVIVRELGTTSDGKTVVLHFRDCISGAAIAGVVHRAVGRALRRDRTEKAPKAGGVTLADLRSAVYESAREMADTDIRHEAAIAIGIQIGVPPLGIEPQSKAAVN